MPTWLGIDIGSASVKVASCARRIARSRSCASRRPTWRRAAASSRRLAHRRLAGASTDEPQGSDAVAAAIDGSRAAIHRLLLPATAQKQLADVLAYELEAQVPFDLERRCSTGASSSATRRRAALRSSPPWRAIEDVRARIDLVKEADAQEPERVGVGALVAGRARPVRPGALRGRHRRHRRPRGQGERGARPRARRAGLRADALHGTEGLPGDRAAPRARHSRQLRRPSRQGGAAPDAGVPVRRRSLRLRRRGVSVRGARDPGAAPPDAGARPRRRCAGAPRELPRYAKALALALSLAGRGTRPEPAARPALVRARLRLGARAHPGARGARAVILVSFVFSAWARLHAVAQGARRAAGGARRGHQGGARHRGDQRRRRRRTCSRRRPR